MLPKLLVHAEKEQEVKDPSDCTGKLLQEMKNHPEQLPGISRKTELSYSMIKTNQTPQMQTHQQGLSLLRSAKILWKQYQKFIWNSLIQEKWPVDGKTTPLIRQHRNSDKLC